jgi:ABC-2 type transport system permease protein
MTVASETLELREIRGPSAFGGGWRRTWGLLWLISVTEFRVSYRNTALGYAWSVVKPFVFFGIIYLVVNKVLRFGSHADNFPLALILNLVLFQYFTEATSLAVRAIPAREAMVRKMQFPRIVIPLSINMGATINMFFNLVGIFMLFLIAGLDPRWGWLLLPVVLIVLIILTTTLSMLLAVSYVRYRDVGQGWPLIVRALFYATPILYPISILPSTMQSIIATNPLSLLFSQAQIWVVDGSVPPNAEQVGAFLGLAVPVAIIALIAFSGVWLFDRDAPRVAEAL